MNTPMSMTTTPHRIEVITGVQRRRRWSPEQKAAIVAETYEPGISVSEVARRRGIAPNQLFTWRRLAAAGALEAVGTGEPVVAASAHKAALRRIAELERLLGRKTMETEILKEALDIARTKKLISRTPWPGKEDDR